MITKTTINVYCKADRILFKGACSDSDCRVSMPRQKQCTGTNGNKMRRIQLSLGIAVLLIFVSGNAHGATTYVASASELQTAVDSAAAGDIIYVKDGRYSNFYLTISQSGSEDNCVAIMAENGGKAKLRGNVGVTINADYVKFSGFDFDGATLHSSNNALVNVTGSHNRIEDLYVNHIGNGPHVSHRYVYFTKQATHNVVNRCWLEKGTQHGIAVCGDVDSAASGSYSTVENCYFKAARQPNNGGEAIRFGTGSFRAGLKNGYVIGFNTIRGNLFDHYDGELEIISIKSSHNLVEGNTFTNCFGQLTCRHDHNNIIKDNFFITTEVRPNGDCLTVWGDGHQILNNYFHNTKSRNSTGGAINLASGNHANVSAKFESVENVAIKDNIIYEANSANHAISLGDRGEKIMPKDIAIIGNYIYSSSDKAQIAYVKPCDNVTYSDNKIYKNAGLSPLPEGVTETNPHLKADRYGVYRAGGKGPSGNPLKDTDVGPQWKKGPIAPTAVAAIKISQTSVSIEVTDTTPLIAIIFPDDASDKTVTWSSDNEAVATVNQNGVIKGVSVGEATVTVASNDGSVTALCKVDVTRSTSITYHLKAIHDAYLEIKRDAISREPTLHNASDLKLENGERVSYLMFDLSHISGEVRSADLTLTVGSDFGIGVIKIERGNNTQWTETTLSSANAPASSGFLGSLNTEYAVGQSYTWSLEASSIKTGGKLSLIATRH
ncbi:chondroitinase-B domain-containing protein [Planctomycetota bacterium]